MRDLEFVTILATDKPGVFAVRFTEPVKQDFRRQAPGQGRFKKVETGDLSDDLKRRIEEEVASELDGSHIPETRLVICSTGDEVLAAIERARKAFELARSLTRIGRYPGFAHTQMLQPPRVM